MKLLNKKHHSFILEAATWLSIIVFTAITPLIFPWHIAENLLKNIALVGGGAAVFWYLKSRHLYVEVKKRAEELTFKQHEILNRERTFDLVFRNSIDGFLFLDSDQRIIDFSPGMEKITGFNASGMIGSFVKDVLKFKGDENNSLIPDMMFLPNSVNKQPHIRNTLETKDGRIIDIEASCTLIRGTSKGHDLAFAIIRDMTYENELSRRDKEFIAVTSHQLNTPLSIINGYLALLKNRRAGDINRKQEAYLDEIIQAVKKMITLTSSLLSISRIEQEKIQLNKSDVDVAELLEGLYQNFLPMANKKGINLVFTKITSRMIIYADEDKLTQVLLNLIDNSIKYTKEGTGEVRVKRQDEQTVFSVIDTGIGISKDEIGRISERFYRAQNAIDIDSKGTGLGLFIAKIIVEKHGGELTISSSPGEGTEFTFNIPSE